MSFHVGIGFSSHPDGLVAVQEAVSLAKARLKKEHVDLAIVFNTAQYEPQSFLPVLSQLLIQTRIVGCLTSEVILENRFEPMGIGILLITSEQIKFDSGRVSHLSIQDQRAAGKTFVRNCSSGSNLSARRLLLFFMDGLVHSPAAFVEGIKEEFGHAIPVMGVGSSTGVQFQKTYQYHMDQIMNLGACGLVWSEKCRVGMSCQHGWKPLGQPRTITSSQENTILTIDNKKAIKIYEDLFSGRTPAWNKNRMDTIALRYPLGLRTSLHRTYVVRNITAKLDDGSIVCQDKVSDGARIHIMIGNNRSCIQSAEQAAYEVREQLGGMPARLILVFQSLMRRAVLGRSSTQEIRLIRNVLGDSVPLIGMCSQKEILTTSFEQNSANEIHNSSLMILAIG